MTDATALLAAIVENPWDDLPRLEYADFIQERDEPGDGERAEFIRVQCELADQRAGKFPASESNDRRQDWLESRERELLNASSYLWLPETGKFEWWCENIENPPTPVERIGTRFHRGFPSTLTLSAADFLEHEAVLTWCWGECPAKCIIPKGSPKQIYKTYSNCGPESRWERCETCSGSGRVPPMMECPECGGRRYAKKIARGGTDKVLKQLECKTCSGSGRVARQFRGTEQPITRCVLTSWPPMPRYGATTDPLEMAQNLSREWPGIAFELPLEANSANRTYPEN